jgi:hypothetical protein
MNIHKIKAIEKAYPTVWRVAHNPEAHQLILIETGEVVGRIEWIDACSSPPLRGWFWDRHWSPRGWYDVDSLEREQVICLLVVAKVKSLAFTHPDGPKKRRRHGR